ncbi:MAG TPA: transferase [Epulopiscium sp.]|nr:transferase [Candidatus Epulonipiscium sp.]
MIKTKEIYILGVGNNTAVYIDLVEACGYTPVGLYHYNNDKTGEKLLGVPIIDCNDNLLKQDLRGKSFALSMGDNKLRASLSQQIRSKGGSIPTLIHPTAVVSKYAKIEESVVIQANSVVQAGASIDQDSVISYNSSLSHNSKIGKSCYQAFGSTIGAYVNIQDNVLIGQGATIISGKVDYIGENSIIGAGSVVTKNVEANCVVAGNPAKVVKL